MEVACRSMASGSSSADKPWPLSATRMRVRPPPSPHRGQPNASYLIPHTVRKMADVLNISVAELCGALSDNANRAFGGSW